MNTMIAFFSSPTAEVLTRTLLHSLWQSGGVLILLIMALRVVPQRHSSVRYIIAYGSMLTMLVICTYTFISTWQEVTAASPGNVEHIFHGNEAAPAMPVQTVSSLNGQVNAVINKSAPYIVLTWMVGVVIFLIRLTGSWLFVYRLKKNVNILSNELARQLNDLSKQLNVRRSVTIAESIRVHAPIVIGYMKPILFVPVGFASGLSTEQIEAIFIHELTHIRREDYFMNMVQSVIEVIFFFNPFMWITSSLIRTEREHCCDDAVLQSGRNAYAYVTALAQLEEHRVTQTPLVLSVIGSKNQLLNRIKRIMEKSVNHYSLRDKLVPAMLLLIGVLCASWITLSSAHKNDVQNKAHEYLSSDTTKKEKKSRSATYSKKRVVITSPDAPPQEEAVENYSGDEALLMDMANHDMFPPPGVDVPQIPEFDVPLPPSFDMFVSIDSLPKWSSVNAEQWKQFQQNFEFRFKEQFGDFYAKNQQQISKIMDEMKFEFQPEMDQQWVASMEKLGEMHEMNFKMHEDQMRANEKALRDHAEQMREVEKQMHTFERDHAHQLEQVEKQMKELEKKTKEFEKELNATLRKDGYLKANESLRNIRWDDNGGIEINDKPIRKEDVKKYQDLRKKHFGEEHDEFEFRH